MGQGISLKIERNNPWFKPWFNILLYGQGIRSIFRVLGIYNFAHSINLTLNLSSRGWSKVNVRGVWQDFLFQTSFPVFECPFPVLKHLFLFLNILSCFRTAYSNSEHPKICRKNVNCKQRGKIPLESIWGQMFWGYFWPMYIVPTLTWYFYPHTCHL